jgi:hypothetical protein
MSLMWVLVIAALFAAVLAFRRHRLNRRSRYIDTPAWQQVHWRVERDRERIGRQRML